MHKILSFDGGGLRGLISAVWLNEIQNRLNHEIVSYFDLIAGNSTGSIIAAGLAMGYTPQDIINIYQHEGSIIFPPFWKVALSKLRRFPTHGISSPKYDGKGLRKVLKKYFVHPDGTEIKFTLDDMNGRRLLIPSYNMTIGAPTFFKNYRGEFDHLSVTDVLLSSTAAPTYLPPHEISLFGETATMVDGVMVANNPTACAIAELFNIMTTLDNEEILCLSIGTGTEGVSFEGDKIENWGLVQWAIPIVSIMMDGSADSADYISKQELEQGNYLRIDKVIHRKSPIAIDDASPKTIQRMIEFAHAWFQVPANRQSLDEFAKKLEKSGKSKLTG